MKRLALVGASLVLVGGMATACGSAPEDASKDDFCKAMTEFQGVDNEDDFKDAQDKINDVGTPEEIDGDAREGFELLADLDWDDRNEDKYDEDDQKKVAAFVEKFTELCSPAPDAPATE